MPALVRRLGRRGWGGNVVSAGEWRLATEAGLSNAAITFEGIGKTDQELGKVVRAALDGLPLRWLSVESADELQALTGLCRKLGTGRRDQPPVDVLVRLNPQVEPETAAGLAGVQAWTRGGRAALETWAYLRERWGEQVDTVDFGGGFPSCLAAAPSPAAFRQALDHLIATEQLATPPRLAIEPGRYIVAAAGWILARVLHVRCRGNRQQAVIDAGMTELIRPALYGARHPVHPVSSRCARGELLETAVEGPVCESSDTLGVHRLPPLQRGDLVAIAGTGAYASALAMRYNGRPHAAEVFIHPSGDLELARTRERAGWGAELGSFPRDCGPGPADTRAIDTDTRL